MIAPAWPTPQELQPALEKLEAHPGSVILVAVESAEAHCNFCRITWAWLAGKSERRCEPRCLRRRTNGDPRRSLQTRCPLS